jgi:poly(3-hydroxybutyrate) depolymerase
MPSASSIERDSKMMKRTLLIAGFVSLLFYSLRICEASESITTSIPMGKGKASLQIGTRTLQAFTYRSKDYAAVQGPLILVFHGMVRNAEDYRDYAQGLADECGGMIVAPHFDSEQFPGSAYSHGNVVIEGKITPKEEWTYSLVVPLIEKIRELEGRKDMPYYLIGHSAGGRFLQRLMAFSDVKPVRAMAANPGSHLLPTKEVEFPYGFGNLPHHFADHTVLKAYLAAPLIINVGTADTDPNDPDLDQSETAQQQGPHRHARGLRCFEEAQKLAQAHGWECNWRLVETPGVEHSAAKMIDHPECRKALFAK